MKILRHRDGAISASCAGRSRKIARPPLPARVRVPVTSAQQPLAQPTSDGRGGEVKSESASPVTRG